MKFARLACLLATFAVSAACSGQYQVGSDAPSAGGPNVPVATAGAPNEGASEGGSGPTGPSTDSVAGASTGILGSGDSAGPSFCGYPLLSAESVPFAPPSVVYQRVFKFLLARDEPFPESLPSETTREWAGSLAASVLSSSMPSAKGMDRFVAGWWPGTPTPDYWAAKFSSKQATFTDLLSTDSQLPHGAGVLTDPAVLSHAGIAARGNFVMRQLLCAEVPLDPDNGILPALLPGQTRRTQHDQVIAAPVCKGCHNFIDPFGYALGNFATDGNYRTIENGLPIDTQATVPVMAAGSLMVRDAQSLGETLASTCSAAICLTRTMMSDALTSAGIVNGGSEQDILAIAAQFSADLSLPDLVRLMVESDSFLRAD